MTDVSSVFYGQIFINIILTVCPIKFDANKCRIIQLIYSCVKKRLYFKYHEKSTRNLHLGFEQLHFDLIKKAANLKMKFTEDQRIWIIRCYDKERIYVRSSFVFQAALVIR